MNMMSGISGRYFLVIVLWLASMHWCCQAPPGSEDDDGGLQGAVLIVLDTVRADHLSCYGYNRETSPALTQLADQGTLFETVVAYSPWTLPSMLNLLSGRTVDQRVFEGRLKRSLVESIKQAGYTTGAVTEGGFVSRHFGLDRGFQSWVEEESAVQLLSPGQARNPHPSGGIENTFQLAREWITRHREEKFFLLIHTYEPHAPYTRQTYTRGLEAGAVGEIFSLEQLPALQSGRVRFQESDLQYFEALYDGGIHYSDSRVDDFLEHLEREGLRDRTLMVVTSDHGEELGGHYPNYCGDHGHSLYDDLLLVPLIIHNPRQAYAVQRVGQQVRLMDVMPTITDILGLGIGEKLDGRSLLPLMQGTERRGRMAAGGSVKTGPERQYLRMFDYKLIQTTGPRRQGYPLQPEPQPVRLFDLQTDPGEQVNLARTRPDILAGFNELLVNLQQAGYNTGEGFTIPETIDEKLKTRLRSLGYLQ